MSKSVDTPKQEKILASHPVEEVENPGEHLSGMKSLGSTNNSSLNQRYPTARELSETFSGKIFEMKWVIISFVVNSMLLYYLVKMGDGLQLGVSIEASDTFACVVIEVLLLVANIITFRGLNDGAAALFGWRLSNPEGYSVAVCGYVQSQSWSKFTFTSELSLNSSCRKLLTRISIFFVLLDFLKLLTPLSATALDKKSERIDEGEIACFLFEEKGEPVDRTFPTIASTQGFAELIFGTALGDVRSEFPLDNTTAVMAPQIVGAVVDGDTISGNGTLTTLLTECDCTTDMTADAIKNIADYMSLEDAQGLIDSYNNSTGYQLVNHLKESNGTHVMLTTLMKDTTICGASNSKFVPICRTAFSEHRQAYVMIRYMTDGSPSSIAAEDVDIRQAYTEEEVKLDIVWVYYSLSNILGGKYSSIPLPSTVPGIVNPIMWWTTPNLVASDPSLLEAGLETTFTMVLRAGMQRTLPVKGGSCLKNVTNPNASVLTMYSYGVLVAVIILTYQLLICFVSFLCFIPWFFKNEPIGPCVRILKDKIYFDTLLHTSTAITGYHELCNAPTHAIWQMVDVPCRIGESIQTANDDVGHITLDKPKMVKPLTNGRKYY